MSIVITVVVLAAFVGLRVWCEISSAQMRRRRNLRREEQLLRQQRRRCVDARSTPETRMDAGFLLYTHQKNNHTYKEEISIGGLAEGPLSTSTNVYGNPTGGSMLAVNNIIVKSVLESMDCTPAEVSRAVALAGALANHPEGLSKAGLVRYCRDYRALTPDGREELLTFLAELGLLVPIALECGRRGHKLCVFVLTPGVVAA